MAVTVKSKKGKDVVLLNPSEKGAKYADELSYNFRLTNKGTPKLDEKNTMIPLTDAQRAYRSGYLDAQKDSARCYNARKKKGK